MQHLKAVDQTAQHSAGKLALRGHKQACKNHAARFPQPQLFDQVPDLDFSAANQEERFRIACRDASLSFFLL